MGFFFGHESHMEDSDPAIPELFSLYRGFVLVQKGVGFSLIFKRKNFFMKTRN